MWHHCPIWAFEPTMCHSYTHTCTRSPQSHVLFRAGGILLEIVQRDGEPSRCNLDALERTSCGEEMRPYLRRDAKRRERVQKRAHPERIGVWSARRRRRAQCRPHLRTVRGRLVTPCEHFPLLHKRGHRMCEHLRLAYLRGAVSTLTRRRSI